MSLVAARGDLLPQSRSRVLTHGRTGLDPGHTVRYPTLYMAEIGSQKKRDIAMVIASLLNRHETYSAKAIERIIADNVRAAVLAQRGCAPDHIRRAMIENGYVVRDAETNETKVASGFVGFDDTHRQRISELTHKLNSQPDSVERCPVCSVELKMAALLNHYLKKHAGSERWEQIVDQYFG